MAEHWKNIISGIGNGIKNAAKNLVNAAVSAAKNAVNAVKGWLGIASPSKLMRDQVGKYMALGMGVGFEKNIPVDDMTSGIDESIKSMQRKVQIITRSQGTSASRETAQRRDIDPKDPVDIDYERMGDVIAEALDGTEVDIDGEKAGKILTPHISNNEYLNTRRRR